jgi:hypothetical protein
MTAVKERKKSYVNIREEKEKTICEENRKRTYMSKKRG